MAGWRGGRGEGGGGGGLGTHWKRSVGGGVGAVRAVEAVGACKGGQEILLHLQGRPGSVGAVGGVWAHIGSQ